MKNINYEKTLAYQYPALVEEWHPVKKWQFDSTANIGAFSL